MWNKIKEFFSFSKEIKDPEVGFYELYRDIKNDENMTFEQKKEMLEGIAEAERTYLQLKNELCPFGGGVIGRPPIL